VGGGCSPRLRATGRSAVPYIDVTAAEMLVALTEELGSEGVRLVIVGDVARVRDVLRRTSDDDAAKPSLPTVAAAVADLQADT
jgi:sulfate permease, SulP family